MSERSHHAKQDQRLLEAELALLAGKNLPDLEEQAAATRTRIVDTTSEVAGAGAAADPGDRDPGQEPPA